MATVLVVDDDAANRLLVESLLGYGGHTVLSASDGAAGLVLARERRPDLVILDLGMPGIGGAGFVRALRDDPETFATPVALYTATAVEGAIADFVELYGIAHVIPKPCEPPEMLRIVALALAQP
ncbi:MAG: response regulator [Candidatus Eremiobacteraeota bacterium]|nr:response regulator [Candidatus Eremiobacteraeota bacterium]